jgi:large subunit ribosomal protein L30
LLKEEALKYQKYIVNLMNKKVKKLRVKLVKSRFGRIKKHKASIAGIGLRKINQVVEIEATPENLGMVNKINYLVEVEEI